MSFADLIRAMSEAAARGDGAAVAACFTPDGVYDDVFYGAFQGQAIVDLIENHFHRDATNFRWDIHDPVAVGDIGYARYVFSYESTMAGTEGTRAIFEGVAVCRLRDGRLASYSEIANAATGLHCLGFPPERLAKFVAKQTDALKSRDEAKQHLQ